jgi:hypothetical protein
LKVVGLTLSRQRASAQQTRLRAATHACTWH